MIYGWNFNSTPIPEPVKKQFAQVKQIAGIGRVRLQGATDSKEELDCMLVQANNGHRRLLPVGPRKIKGVEWYAVYCS